MIEKIAIENREQWLALRSQDVTASVAGALLGVHPYTSAYGLFLMKDAPGQIARAEDELARLGPINPLLNEDERECAPQQRWLKTIETCRTILGSDVEESGPMRRGRLLEPVAAQILREDRPEWEIKHPTGFYYRDPARHIGATPDVIAFNEKGEPGVIQIKSVEPSIFRRDWMTEHGVVEPPLWIVCQAIIEAHLTGAMWAAVAPMVVSFGVEMPIVPVPIHAGVLDRIKTEVAQFWRKVATGDQYPPDYALDGRLIASLYPRDSGLQIDLSGDNAMADAVVSLESARAAKKEAASAEKIAKATINDKMQEAALALLPDGRMVSNKSTRRAGYFVNETEFRTIRVLKEVRRT